MMNPATFYALIGTVFGWQWNYPDDGEWGNHHGQDFPWRARTDIPAWAAGTVVEVGYNTALGNYIVIQRADGLFMGFCHLVERAYFDVGQSVEYGDIVGKVGSTGEAKGAHLHATTSINRYPGTGPWMDPLPIIQASIAAASGGGGGKPTDDTEEDEMTKYRALESSTDGVIVAGWIYVQDAAGPLRAVDSLQGLATTLNGKVADYHGNDIRSIVARVGLLQYEKMLPGLKDSAGNLLQGPGKLTGRVIY